MTFFVFSLNILVYLGAGTQVTYSVKIYIKQKKFSSLQKRCRYAVPARTVTKNP